jgi:hypothetical protein
MERIAELKSDLAIDWLKGEGDKWSPLSIKMHGEAVGREEIIQQYIEHARSDPSSPGTAASAANVPWRLGRGSELQDVRPSLG